MAATVAIDFLMLLDACYNYAVLYMDYILSIHEISNCMNGCLGLAMDEPLEQRICTAILKQLDDQSNDVQSVAVKCLGILFKRIHLVQMEKISDKLCIHLLQGKNE